MRSQQPHNTRVRRARLVLATGMAAAALAVYLPGQLLAAPSHTTARAPIHLVETEVSTVFVDTGAPGPGAGDSRIVRSRISTPKGKTIGRADFDCVLTGAGRAMGGLCNAVLTLPGGQITGAVAFGAAGESKLQAITGGTGRYKGASGQFLIGRSHGRSEQFTIELTG